MVRAELAGLTIHRCPECRGIFLDDDTFDYLIRRQARLALDAQEPGTGSNPNRVKRGLVEDRVVYRSCPVCGRQMARRNYANCAGVIYDLCLSHGVWLDDAELQGILSFIATGGHGLAERLEHEAQESLGRRRDRVDEMDRQSRAHGPAGLDLSDLI
jgi:Zn-finger nucleic acid-binding protein